MRRRFLAGSLAAGAGVSADEAAAGALLVIGTVGGKASGFAAEAECIIAGEMKADSRTDCCARCMADNCEWASAAASSDSGAGACAAVAEEAEAEAAADRGALTVGLNGVREVSGAAAGEALAEAACGCAIACDRASWFCCRADTVCASAARD